MRTYILAEHKTESLSKGGRTSIVIDHYLALHTLKESVNVQWGVTEKDVIADYFRPGERIGSEVINALKLGDVRARKIQ